MHVTYSEGYAFLNHNIASGLIIEPQSRLQSRVGLSLTYWRLIKANCVSKHGRIILNGRALSISTSLVIYLHISKGIINS